jgi:hypothetical protein
MNLTRVTNYHKTHGLNGISAIDYLWKPIIEYYPEVGIEIMSQELYLSPNGKAERVRKIKATFKCTFDFSKYPNDLQTCYIQPYLTRYQ